MDVTSRTFMDVVQLVCLLVVVWLSISSGSILVLLSGASAEACAFWRLLLSVPLLYLVGTLQSGKPTVLKVKLHHVVSGISLALHFVFWMRSLFIIPVYISTLLVAVYPFYSLLIEVIAYRRKLPLRQLVGFLACTILLAMYLGVHELVFNIGVVEAIVAGFLVAVYFEVGSYARYKLKESTTAYAISTYLIAAFFVALFAQILGVGLLYHEPVKYVFFVALAVVPMMLGHTLINYMLGKYPASIATSIGYGEPFGAGLLAYLLLKQEISLTHIVFGTLIIITVFITVTTLCKK